MTNHHRTWRLDSAELIASSMLLGLACRLRIPLLILSRTGLFHPLSKVGRRPRSMDGWCEQVYLPSSGPYPLT